MSRKELESTYPISCATFHLKGEGKGISEGYTGGYEPKSATCSTMQVVDYR